MRKLGPHGVRGLADNFNKFIRDSLVNHDDESDHNKPDNNKRDGLFHINDRHQQHIIFRDEDDVDGNLQHQ
ncbi:unnamed protein product, partial [Symbiodinium natans]